MASCGEVMDPFIGRKAKAASVMVFFTTREQSKGLNELVSMAGPVVTPGLKAT